MGLSSKKINTQKRTWFLGAEQFNQKLPTLRVAAGTIGTDMGLGLTANANTASLVGGVGITATRDLLTNPTDVYAGLHDATVVWEKVAATIPLVGIKMNASGDVVRHLMEYPLHWDTRKNIRARVHAMCASIVGSETGTLTVGLLPQNAGSDWGTGATGITFTTSVVPAATTLYPLVSAWASPAYSWANLRRDYPNAINMLLRVTRSTFTITGDFWLTGVEIEYTPRL